MASEAQTRAQKAFHQLITDLDKSCVRRIQADLHRCAAQCCDRTDTSLEANHECINRCSQPLQSANTYIDRELTEFQDRIERCVLSCQDSIKESIGTQTSDNQMKAFTAQFESCAVKCVDTNLEKIPPLRGKMNDYIKSSFHN